MKREFCMRVIVVLAVFLTANNAFSMSGVEEKGKKNYSFEEVVNSQDEILKIYKKREKEVDVYTFAPKGVIDEYTITSIENRLKTMFEDFVSFSVDDKNIATVVMKPAISDENFELVIAIVTKPYEYVRGDFEIIELE